MRYLCSEAGPSISPIWRGIGMLVTGLTIVTIELIF
jgi:hypothetical protein